MVLILAMLVMLEVLGAEVLGPLGVQVLRAKAMPVVLEVQQLRLKAAVAAAVLVLWEQMARLLKEVMGARVFVQPLLAHKFFMLVAVVAVFTMVLLAAVWVLEPLAVVARLRVATVKVGQQTQVGVVLAVLL